MFEIGVLLEKMNLSWVLTNCCLISRKGRETRRKKDFEAFILSNANFTFFRQTKNFYRWYKFLIWLLRKQREGRNNKHFGAYFLVLFLFLHFPSKQKGCIFIWAIEVHPFCFFFNVYFVVTSSIGVKKEVFCVQSCTCFELSKNFVASLCD